ncbi:BCAR1, Cas family scaffold protein L homeolog [Xenopus laevis]|uniref:Breast cancer anti-estrogen resistance protein 1 n=1 Tax=Xenopus laevis TaxID=8355 RepID=Q6PAF8_XENLA|nr:BCAR1, Cas family scaffold protein L homeolog [Xenopus laevis]AAH60334.1 MGC68466 protein [Xenopus laevis]
MNYLNVLAKALYDNVAESPDELSFRKGDIMTVLERNTQGLDGWWLCSLHGRQGIVPGNRLKILVGMYDKKQGSGDQCQQKSQQQPQQQPPQTPLTCQHQGVYNVVTSTNQYTPMQSAYQSPGGENVYLMPALSKGQQGLYQNPQGQPHPGQTTPSKQATLYQNQPAQHQFPGQEQDIYQVPPSMNQPQELYQVPVGSTSPPQLQDVYQVPPSSGTVQDIYQVPSSMTSSQEIYQVPPSMDMRGAEVRKMPGKVVLPTRVGQVYVYDAPKSEQQDEYDVPRHLGPSGPQEIYDVPSRCLVNNYSPEVYDIPPMAVKGPVSRQQTQEIYDIPPSVEKNLHDQLQSHLMIYDIPPSVSKDVPDGPTREETYDFPPAFSSQKMQGLPQATTHAVHEHDPNIPEEIYDIPPTAIKGSDISFSQEIYDVPPSLRKPAGQTFLHDVYDVPREFHSGKSTTEIETDYIYDVPPQVDREIKAVDESVGNFKRLSASSTGSTRSNISTSSLDTIPVKESAVILPKPVGKELNLDLEAAMELLVKLQHGVNSSVSYLMSFLNGPWRSLEQMEANIQSIQSAVEGVKSAMKELLEFARGAVVNSVQASDRTLHTKLSKQLQKMEEVYQQLIKYSQALDNCNWSLDILATNKQSTSDDLERFIMYSKGIPDDVKQLASFLHGNASLLFKRAKHHLSLSDLQDNSNHFSNNNNNLSVGQTGHTEKTSIQSRPLPSPPKFIAEESPEGQYENNESGWMEDYDYVHLQGKEEFEKTQKELLEKGNIIKQGKGHLEQQQLKQFERLQEEVARPIESDLSNWTPPQHYSQVRSALGNSDRQLLLFYQEQCEANVTTLTNAIDAFYSSISSNQPPKIFVAHSKFVILSAHKLVFIGDTLSRQAKAQDIRNKVTHHSNILCDKLKEIVLTTKTAALQYPSPAAAKDMVDRVKDLNSSTQQFRMVLGQLAAM